MAGGGAHKGLGLASGAVGLVAPSPVSPGEAPWSAQSPCVCVCPPPISGGLVPPPQVPQPPGGGGAKPLCPRAHGLQRRLCPRVTWGAPAVMAGDRGGLRAPPPPPPLCSSLPRWGLPGSGGYTAPPPPTMMRHPPLTSWTPVGSRWGLGGGGFFFFGGGSCSAPSIPGWGPGGTSGFGGGGSLGVGVPMVGNQHLPGPCGPPPPSFGAGGGVH